MNQKPHPAASLFTQVDITPTASASRSESTQFSDEQAMLLRQILAAQDRTNEILEEMVNVIGATQRQRSAELNQWKKANPDLSHACRKAAESLSRVQIEFLNALTEEVDDHGEALMDGEFMLNEFVDRFGPRLAHLNGVLQVLSQLSTQPNSTSESTT
jgi:hypothetical protein